MSSPFGRGIGNVNSTRDLALLRSPVHSVDARAKWVVTLALAVTVTSFGKYDISRVMPLFLYPFVITALSGLPVPAVAKRSAAALPFILLVGVFNPLIDREPMAGLGPVVLSGGWVSFISILVRSTLIVSSVVLLAMTTRPDNLFAALESLGVPSALVVQLQFMNRYIGLLGGEVEKTLRAHSLRSPGKGGGIPVLVSGPMLGGLLLRTMDRGSRIHRAMVSRGFDGAVRAARPSPFSPRRDGLFVCAWLAYFALARFVDLPGTLLGVIGG